MEYFIALLVAALVALVFTLRSRLETQEQRLAELTRRVWELEQAKKPLPPPPAVLQRPVFVEETVLPPPPAVEAPPPIPPAPERSLAEVLGLSGNQEWETLIGGSILNKAGALILVIGIALFLGYSFGHLTPSGRAGIALAVSLLLLGAGLYLERKGRYRMFSRGLIGAGWAALYATSYAIYALPEARVISNPFFGSLVMLSVALGMVAHSLYYRAQAVTAVAYFAAFAALAATPSSPFAAISLIPLAVSLLYLASRFEWYWLPLFGLAATYLTVTTREQSGAPLAATEALFLIYWLLFEGFDWLRVKRRVMSGALHWIAPVNTFFFVGLSYANWSNHPEAELWRAAAFGAGLYLADTGIRFYLRPPSSFLESEATGERVRAGSFEGTLVVAASLAGLAIVGKASNMWAAAALAVEAEILYLAGVQLSSRFVRGVGMAGFVCSLADLGFEAATASKTNFLGLSVWQWTPTAAFHAGLFYANRAIRKPNVMFSVAASTLIGLVLAYELRTAWIGFGWGVLGALLFEVGFFSEEKEFLQQGYVLLFLGCFATFAVNVTSAHSPLIPLGLTLAAAYGYALRRHPPLQIGATAATGLLSALLIYRLVPEHRLGLAWIAAAILMLLHELVLGLKEFRVTGIGVAALAALAVAANNIDPAQLWLSIPVVAGLYAAQYLMRLLGLRPEETLFSIAASLLLSIVLYGRVSGGLLTVAWGCEGLALLGIGFPLGQRVLRIQGLVLLLICILKLFLFDLRNLETMYRILSFVALGLILLAVSWIYTRFQEQIKKLL
jgi:hypothetical protein